MQLTIEPTFVSASLIERVSSLYGRPMIASLPAVGPDGDHAAAFDALLKQVQQSAVAVFPGIRPGNLDAFFHLRLAQVLKGAPPLRALSVVVLSPGLAGPKLAGGFAERFRTAWPFDRCIFVADGSDPPVLSRQLGLPVEDPGIEAGPPEILQTDARAGQKIALHLQEPWYRCGSTTAFENQVEDLVRAGFLTIRLFTSGVHRRGPTLDSRLETIISDNSTHAGAHINLLAVPDGPPAFADTEDPTADWATWLASTALCRIRDSAVMEAAKRADSVIANHIYTVGLAVHLAPRARLLLDVHDNRTVSTLEWMRQEGKSEAETAAATAAAEQAQARVLAIPDICTHVSVDELAQLGPQSQRSAIVLPRVYLRPGLAPAPPRFDLFLVGDRHDFNIASLQWFLETVWRPHLEPAGLSAAIAGRAGQHLDTEAHASPSLRFYGYVEDLDTLRSQCRLTVVPDRAGSGIAIKMLSALAAGHPLVITPMGLRGLDPSIARMLPAFDDPDAFAADILDLVRNPGHLADRRSLVEQAHQALYRGRSYVDLLRAVPVPSTRVSRRRLADWATVSAAALQPEKAAYHLALDTPFPLSGSKWDHQVLLDGWHDAEPWGRWTDGAEASLRIELAAPVAGPLRLELDIVPSTAAPPLTVLVDGEPLGTVKPTVGVIGWDLPPDRTAGKAMLVVTLHMTETVCAARSGDSPDDRILGIGVRSVRLTSRPTPLFDVGRDMPIRPGALPQNVLLSGWHMVEDWGCWSSGETASLQLISPQPLKDPLRLELNIMPSAARAALTVSVNGHALPAVFPRDGVNRWILPPKVTGGQTRLLFDLFVSETFCPARAGTAADDRILGVGLRGIELVAFVPAACAVGRPLRLAPPVDLDGVLLDGWHPPEPWGTWTNARDAALRLTPGETLSGSFALEFEFAGRAVETTLTVTVNGSELPPILTAGGSAVRALPAACTDGRRELLVGLRVSETFRPADFGARGDDRILGIGVRSVTLVRKSAAFCPIGDEVAVSSRLGDSGMLVDGWHRLETWGCWTAGAEASMKLPFTAPLEGDFVLQMNLLPPLLDKQIALVVNDVALPLQDVADGLNEWVLPRNCTDGQDLLRIEVGIAHPARPSDITESTDDRILGVGLRAFAVVPAT